MTRRKVLARYGVRGDIVKAVEETALRRVVVYYRDAGGIEHKRYFDLTATGRAEAKAFAAGWHEEKKAQADARKSRTPDVTTAQLWERFCATELSGLRGATIISYRYHWQRWQAFIGRDRVAGTVTVEDCARFRSEVAAAGIALNQVRQTLQLVRGVYRWGVGAQLFVDRGVLAFRWKRRKDDPRPMEPAEYTADEFERLLAAVDREDARQWRAWVFLMLAGHHGQRANAVLHLRWRDIDLDAGIVRWPSTYQKQGVDLVHPLLWETIAALRTADTWRERASHYRVRMHHKGTTAGPERLASADWLLFAERDKARPMSYTSLHYHLREAEQRAGIEHKALRAAHGFRRMVVGEVAERSGDRMLGLEYVGDVDPKMLKAYDRRRQNRIDLASATIETVRKTSVHANADETPAGNGE